MGRSRLIRCAVLAASIPTVALAVAATVDGEPLLGIYLVCLAAVASAIAAVPRWFRERRFRARIVAYGVLLLAFGTLSMWLGGMTLWLPGLVLIVGAVVARPTAPAR